jgi:hypothetical protein
MKAPNFRKMLKEGEAWKVSARIEKKGNRKIWMKKSVRSQHSIPNDKNLLAKVGLNKKDKILTIAGYYGDWTNALAKAGCKTTYSEISQPLTNWARKKFSKNKNIKKFVCANYITLPKNKNEFDWTITFEPVGGEMGLSIAIIRSLLNKKGFKVIHYPRENKPLESYARYKLLANVYNCNFNRKSVFIKGINYKFQSLDKKHIITTIKTNEKARKKAMEDINSLEKNKFTKESLKRLNQISKLIDKRYLKKIN